MIDRDVRVVAVDQGSELGYTLQVGGGLIDHHQQAPVAGQLVVESTQALLVVGKGLVKDFPPVPAQGSGPVLCLTEVNADEDVDVLDIHLYAASRCMGAGLAGGRAGPRTHACERPHTQRAVPLISGHQRPAPTTRSY